jgi:hypothetical protein
VKNEVEQTIGFCGLLSKAPGHQIQSTQPRLTRAAQKRLRSMFPSRDRQEAVFTIPM